MIRSHLKVHESCVQIIIGGTTNMYFYGAQYTACFKNRKLAKINDYSAFSLRVLSKIQN